MGAGLDPERGDTAQVSLGTGTKWKGQDGLIQPVDGKTGSASGSGLYWRVHKLDAWPPEVIDAMKITPGKEGGRQWAQDGAAKDGKDPCPNAFLPAVS